MKLYDLNEVLAEVGIDPDNLDEGFPKCPVCNGATEVTPSGALTCRIYGSSHYRLEPPQWGPTRR